MAKFKGLELLREESGPREETTLHGPSSSGDPSAKVGPRHMGKRQNPAYQQISAYVKRDIYEKVRVPKLLQPAKGFRKVMTRERPCHIKSQKEVRFS